MQASWFRYRLKELREQAGLTQAELAARVGMHRFGIAKLEQGITQPSWATVVALCQALKTGCDAFLQEPAERPAPRRGRPAKPDVDGQGAEARRPPKGWRRRTE